MGCYGIGVNRILASAVETRSDDNGIVWPITIAPFEVLLTCANQDEPRVAEAAEGVYGRLLDAGIEVLYDDRLLRGGVKFKDADLIGIPVRVTVGKKSVAEGQAEIKLRRESQSRNVPIDQVARQTAELVACLKQEIEV